MKLIALMLALTLEHFASNWLHLRELGWFDPFLGFVLRRARASGRVVATLSFVAALALLLLPVGWVSVVLSADTLIWDAAYLAFAVVVLFFCLGPRDLGNEVGDYCAALDRGDEERSRSVLAELADVPASAANVDTASVEDAVFVQANNRIFAVVFWFVLLGPVGAWLFRLSDLARKRAVAFADDPAEPAFVDRLAIAFHGVLAWLPARLAVIGYALGGSFDEAFDRWRNFHSAEGDPFYRGSERLLRFAGRAAMSGFLAQPENSSAGARNAMRLVTRTVWIWTTVVALMTLFGWAV